MRFAMLVLCLAATACGGQTLNSPTSPAIGVAGPSGSAAQAGTDLPFRGSFVGSSSAVFVPPNTLRITGAQEGTATHLGRFTSATVDNANTTDNTGAGTIDFTAADGDHLFATTVGIENELVPPNVSKVRLDGTIIGGTGRFAGATGSFTYYLTQEIDFAAATSITSGSFDGSLSFDK
jgi:hypothetical protein